MRAIAKKADRLIAMHAPHSHDACAAVATEDQPEELSMVAAAQGARSHKGKGPKRPQQLQQRALCWRVDLSKRG